MLENVLKILPRKSVFVGFDQDLERGYVTAFREAVGYLMAHNDLFHQHKLDGSCIYRYPLIHYREISRCLGCVTAWGAATEHIDLIPWAVFSFDFGSAHTVKIFRTKSESSMVTIEHAQQPLYYKFWSPVLLLNQKNYRKYRTMRSERTNELNRLLIAAILMALRGLDVFFPERLAVNFHGEPEWGQHKGQSLLGFTGTFTANISLPNDFAVGHAVSHGFGAIRRIVNAPL